MRAIQNLIIITILLFALEFFIFSNTSFAQTRCPVEVQAGSAQCLTDDQVSAPPRSTSQWIKTWGGIATSPSGNSGVSSGISSKKEAEDVALQNCRNSDVKNCKVEFYYYNKCVALGCPHLNVQGLYSENI